VQLAVKLENHAALMAEVLSAVSLVLVTAEH
jgi:hypothetical protein